ILHALLSPRAVVAVAVPISPVVLNILETLDATVIPVHSDYYGPVPASLLKALQHQPQLFIYQARNESAGNEGCHRKQAIANVLSDSSMLLVEHDMMSSLSRQPVWSLGEYYPERTIHIVSYANAYGPDLRLAIVSGPCELIQKLQAFRYPSHSWNSRILQGALAWLLQDQQTQQAIADARVVYQRRRQALISALLDKDIKISKKDLFNIWLKVPCLPSAVSRLAARGVTVLVDKRCCDVGGYYIRITTSRLKIEQIDKIAESIATIYVPL
ncbi:MAG: aminotransferase class I/II-fold pyridoxal phosphate-dependent enzyme, partial [Enterobacteriaceae bacterium]